MMTLTEFLDEFRRVAKVGKAELVANRRLRLSARRRWARGAGLENWSLLCCPITAVAFAKTGRRFSTVEFYSAAAAIGLRPSTAKRIANAADGVHTGDQRLRKQLLEAAGLEG